MTLTELAALVPVEGKRGVEAQIETFATAVLSSDFMPLSGRGIDALLRSVRAISTVTGARKRHAGYRRRATSYSYVTVTTRSQYEYALSQLPAGWKITAPYVLTETRQALDGEVAVKITPKLYRRYCYDRAGGCVWQPIGVACRLTRTVDNYDHLATAQYWEHGIDEATCLAECDRKSAMAKESFRLRIADQREQFRTDRRARLVARLCRRATVTAADVRNAGACMAGIEAWCATHGVDPSASLPLPELARDKSAQYYALQIARRITR